MSARNRQLECETCLGSNMCGVMVLIVCSFHSTSGIVLCLLTTSTRESDIYDFRHKYRIYICWKCVKVHETLISIGNTGICTIRDLRNGII